MATPHQPTPPPINHGSRAIAAYVGEDGDSVGIGIYTVAVINGKPELDRFVAGLGFRNLEHVYSLARELTVTAWEVERIRKERNQG